MPRFVFLIAKKYYAIKFNLALLPMIKSKVSKAHSRLVATSGFQIDDHNFGIF